jgi:hypothetical protein
MIPLYFLSVVDEQFQTKKYTLNNYYVTAQQFNVLQAFSLSKTKKLTLDEENAVFHGGTEVLFHSEQK